MQNKSHAVMSQRHEAHDSLDDFPTPPWAARALCEHVLEPKHYMLGHVWEPACNRGYLVKGLRDYFPIVTESDIFQYGNHLIHDFLFAPPYEAKPDWIISNPPFRLGEQFCNQAIRLAEVGCAMLVRAQFLEGADRYDKLFKDRPPTITAQFVERVPMVKGRYDPKASTATAYCWLVWIRGEKPRSMVWIPPCRKQLERPGDYDQPGSTVPADASTGGPQRVTP